MVLLLQDSGGLPLGASVPPLGLSNRAMVSVEGRGEDVADKLSVTKGFAEQVPTFAPLDLTGTCRR